MTQQKQTIKKKLFYSTVATTFLILTAFSPFLSATKSRPSISLSHPSEWSNDLSLNHEGRNDYDLNTACSGCSLYDAFMQSESHGDIYHTLVALIETRCNQKITVSAEGHNEALWYIDAIIKEILKHKKTIDHHYGTNDNGEMLYLALHQALLIDYYFPNLFIFLRRLYDRLRNTSIIKKLEKDVLRVLFAKKNTVKNYKLCPSVHELLCERFVVQNSGQEDIVSTVEASHEEGYDDQMLALQEDFRDLEIL